MKKEDRASVLQRRTFAASFLGLNSVKSALFSKIYIYAPKYFSSLGRYREHDSQT